MKTSTHRYFFLCYNNCTVLPPDCYWCESTLVYCLESIFCKQQETSVYICWHISAFSDFGQYSLDVNTDSFLPQLETLSNKQRTIIGCHLTSLTDRVGSHKFCVWRYMQMSTIKRMYDCLWRSIYFVFGAI